MDRTPIIAGNWKMHKTIGETKAFIQTLIPLVKTSTARIFLTPPFTALAAGSLAAKSSSICIGAQNISDLEEGARTGEISAKMIKDAGASFVLLGHSERRRYFHETDEEIHRKIEQAIKESLTPLFCIGETEQERKEKKTEKVVQLQIEKGLKGFTSDQLSSLVVAYEPVWAIGTGQNATPEMAEEMHGQIRTVIKSHFGTKMAENMAILYGGSVKPENTTSLMKQPNIDGVLVGGASLDVHSFATLISLGKKT